MSLICLSLTVPLIIGGHPGWFRVYFGADYRAHGLLIGSLAGLAYGAGYLRDRHFRLLPVRLAGLLAAGFLAYLLLFVKTHLILDDYVVLFPAIALASTTVVTSVAFTTDRVALLVLSNPVVSYLGRRSYAVYLWHYPMGLAFHRLEALPQLAIAGLATLLAAELSYRLVERPILLARDGKRQQDVSVQPERLEAPAYST